METTAFGTSQSVIDGISVLIGLVIVLYYVFLISMVISPEKHQKKPSKRMLLLGLIPFALWIVIFCEEFIKLEW